MSIAIKIKGLDEVIAKFDKIAQETADEVNGELDAFGQAVVKDAKGLVSANSSDEGGLLRSIDSSVGSLNVTITARQNYAAYIEFGTRKFAASYISSLPSEWQAYAGTFRGDKTGDSGDFNDFVQAIMAWAQRKGIGALKTKSGRNSQSAASYDSMQQAAYWIALNILQNGIRPKPFLYPSIVRELPKLEKRIENIFK